MSQKLPEEETGKLQKDRTILFSEKQTSVCFIGSWMCQGHVARLAGWIGAQGEGLCIHAQKAEFYPSDSKTSREFLCMNVT